MDASSWWVFVGTKSDGRTGGASLPVLRFDSDTGSLSMAHTDAAKLPAPSWLTVTPDAEYLYATCRAEDLAAAAPTGIGSLEPDDHFVAAFAVDRRSGALRPLGRQLTVNMGPTHCATDGRVVITAQYGGGGVTTFLINPGNGSLQPASDVIQHTFGSNVAQIMDDRDARGPQPRQSAAACHSVNFDPQGRRVLIPDLGADRVYVYDIDETHGKLSPAPTPFYTAGPGSGPRHFAWVRPAPLQGRGDHFATHAMLSAGPSVEGYAAPSTLELLNFRGLFLQATLHRSLLISVNCVHSIRTVRGATLSPRCRQPSMP
jgi:6-phosphogluconolactonase (cycloisomerase 2 family)